MTDPIDRLEGSWALALGSAALFTAAVLRYISVRGFRMTEAGLAVNAALYLWIGADLTVWIGWTLHAAADEHLVVPAVVTGAVLARTFRLFNDATPHDPGILSVVSFVPFVIAYLGGVAEHRARRLWLRRVQD